MSKSWCWVLVVSGLLVSGCGGSSSETPFPEEPIPPHLLRPVAPVASGATQTAQPPGAETDSEPTASATTPEASGLLPTTTSEAPEVNTEGSSR